MELRFTLTEGDYVRAGRAMLHRKTGGRLMYLFLLLCGVICLLGGLVARGGPRYGMMAVGTGGALTAALFIWYSPLMHVRGNLRGSTVAFAPQVWSIDGSGVKATGAAVASSYGWSLVLKLLEDDEYFYFYISQGNAIILPKRAVSPDVTPALRGNLREWLGTRAHLRQG